MKLAFYHGPGDEITTLIRRFDGGPHSHVEIIFSDGIWIGACARDVPRGVRVRKSFEPEEYWCLVQVPATPDQERLVKEFAMSILGAEFDLGAIFSFVLPWAQPTPGKFICTNFVTMALRSGRVADLPDTETPNSLFNLCVGLLEWETVSRCPVL